MSKIVRVIGQQSPVVTDFQGGDALMKDQLELRQEIQQFAVAAMPQALRKALFIVEHGRSAKDILQAAKFIKSVADGRQMAKKTIDGVVKRFTDAQLNTDLDGTDE